MEQLTPFIIALATKYPVLIVILASMGTMRAIFKPLFTMLHAYVASTANTKDDEILHAVEKSKAYVVISFLLDYFGSIKVIPAVQVHAQPIAEEKKAS